MPQIKCISSEHQTQMYTKVLTMARTHTQARTHAHPHTRWLLIKNWAQQQTQKPCSTGGSGGSVTETDSTETTSNDAAADVDTQKGATSGDLITVASTSANTNSASVDAKEEKEDHTTSSIPVPDAQVYKFNRYVDGIFEKINRILKRSYDPVNVRLSTSITLKQGNKKQANGAKKNKG